MILLGPSKSSRIEAFVLQKHTFSQLCPVREMNPNLQMPLSHAPTQGRPGRASGWLACCCGVYFSWSSLLIFKKILKCSEYSSLDDILFLAQSVLKNDKSFIVLRKLIFFSLEFTFLPTLVSLNVLEKCFPLQWNKIHSDYKTHHS